MQDTTIVEWLTELAAKQPTPGGGGVAALDAALSASLIGMVSGYTIGPKWGEVSARMEAMNHEAADLRQQAFELITADATAFAAVGAAYSLTKETPPEQTTRQTAIQAALLNAAQPPQQVAQLAARLLKLATELAPIGNPNVVSDVAVAASQARAALESAIVNIEINASLLLDTAAKTQLIDAVKEAEAAMQQADSIVADVRQRMTR